MKKIHIWFLGWFFFFLLICFVYSQTFEVRVVFQSPTYFTNKEASDTYICDQSQEECKVNYTLELNEWSGFKTIGTKYRCEWDFWMDELTGEEQKCNPNSFIYSKNKNFTTSYKVILKSDESIYLTGSFFVQNKFEIDTHIPEETSSASGENIPIEVFPWTDTSSWEVIDEVWEDEENIIEVPSEEEVWNEVWENPQTETWVTLTQSGQQNSWDENIHTDESLSGTLIWENEAFSWEILSDSWAISENISWTWWIKDFTGSVFETHIQFQSPSYIVDKENNQTDHYNCNSDYTECKVNFNLQMKNGNWFENISSAYICEWDFWIGYITGEEEKCNPSTLVFPIWDFEIQYSVRDKTTKNQVMKKNIFIQHSQKVFIPSTTTSSSSSSSFLTIDIPEISIQSWLDENNNCLKEECRINLIYEAKNAREICEWTFLWGIYEETTLSKCNPWYVQYPRGTFTVHLKVYDKENIYNFQKQSLTFFNIWDEDNFDPESIEGVPIEKKEVEKEYSSFIFSSGALEISRFLVNPVAEDDEFIEIHNISQESINVQNCMLDDMENAGSKPYFIKESLILLPWQKFIFYKSETGLSLNNSWKEQVNISCWEVHERIEWNFSVPKWFVLDADMFSEPIVKITKIKWMQEYTILYESGKEVFIWMEEKKKQVMDIIHSWLSKEEKQAQVVEILQDSFTQEIVSHEWWIKIAWYTLPKMKVFIEMRLASQDDFSYKIFFSKVYADVGMVEVMSDEKWYYEYTTDDFTPWNYEVDSRLHISQQVNIPFEERWTFEIKSWEKNSQAWKTSDILDVVSAYIQLQGKIWENKIVSENKIICKDVEFCSVNFDGSLSIGEKLNYSWDFWNGMVSSKKNPASVKFLSWTYTVILRVWNEKEVDTKKFFVDVIPKQESDETMWEEETQNKITKNNKINIIPAVHAQDTSFSTQPIHIWMTLWMVGVFIVWCIILLRRYGITK